MCDRINGDQLNVVQIIFQFKNPILGWNFLDSCWVFSGHHLRCDLKIPGLWHLQIHKTRLFGIEPSLAALNGSNMNGHEQPM